MAASFLSIEAGVRVRPRCGLGGLECLEVAADGQALFAALGQGCFVLGAHRRRCVCSFRSACDNSRLLTEIGKARDVHCRNRTPYRTGLPQSSSDSTDPTLGLPSVIRVAGASTTVPVGRTMLTRSERRPAGTNRPGRGPMRWATAVAGTSERYGPIHIAVRERSDRRPAPGIGAAVQRRIHWVNVAGTGPCADMRSRKSPGPRRDGRWHGRRAPVLGTRPLRWPAWTAMLPETEPLHRALGLTDDEFGPVAEVLGRPPNHLELALYAVMWSEHCSYKSSRLHLRRLPDRGRPGCWSGPGENAGVIDAGDGIAVAIRIESHNHPSAIEPYQGAATGVGGILRDIFTMGARPARRDGPAVLRAARRRPPAVAVRGGGGRASRATATPSACRPSAASSPSTPATPRTRWSTCCAWGCCRWSAWCSGRASGAGQPGRAARARPPGATASAG